MFIVLAFTAFNADNLQPFAPHGSGGVLAAAAVIFFAYIGFDAVATGSEEAKNPKRDLPVAIIGSLVICTIIYILVSIGAVGALPAAQLAESRRTVCPRRSKTGVGLRLGRIVDRVRCAGGDHQRSARHPLRPDADLLRDGRDGLVPESWADVNPRTGTPVKLTIGFGIFAALVAALRATRCDRRDGQHRDAVRVHPRQRRGHGPAPDQARHAAAVQGADSLHLVPDRHHPLHLPVIGPAMGDLRPVRRLARRRDW